eukprot:9750413-Prorocentrum_lima.AAC.1
MPVHGGVLGKAAPERRGNAPSASRGKRGNGTGANSAALIGQIHPVRQANTSGDGRSRNTK